MTSRHKAIKGTLDTGHATEWNDDHQADFTLEIEEYDLTTGVAITSEWDLAQTSGGSNPVWSLVGAAGQEHAFVVLNTGATTGQISSMRHMLSGAAGNVTSPLDLPALNMALWLEDISGVGVEAEFGFFASATTPFTANQAGAYFRVDGGDLYAVTGTGAAETATLIAAYSEYANYRIKINSTNIEFFVDDLETAAVTQTLTRPAVALTPKVSVISVGNYDETINLDALAWSRLRKQ